jgi:hypothetical protein
MNDHATGAEARGGRRRFLRTGVSLAGAFSIGEADSAASFSQRFSGSRAALKNDGQ